MNMKFVLSGALFFVLLTEGCRQEPVAQSVSDIPGYHQDGYSEIVHGYLNRNCGYAGFGGKVFCAYWVLGTEGTGEAIKEYVWTVCEEYYVSDGNIRRGTGVMLPVALTLKEQGDGTRIISHKAPRNGTLYANDVRELFPKAIQRRILGKDVEYMNRLSGILHQEAEREAKAYYQAN